MDLFKSGRNLLWHSSRCNPARGLSFWRGRASCSATVGGSGKSFAKKTRSSSSRSCTRGVLRAWYACAASGTWPGSSRQTLSPPPLPPAPPPRRSARSRRPRHAPRSARGRRRLAAAEATTLAAFGLLLPSFGDHRTGEPDWGRAHG